MDELTRFAELIRGKTNEDLAETADTTNLVLSREQFMEKMHGEPDGQDLLDLLEDGEWRVVERLGLCTGNLEPAGPTFRIPRWKNLVAHLRIVNKA